MKLVYIAGPYSAPTAWQIEQNVRIAEVLALAVAGLGAMPVCPHTQSRFYYGTESEDFWIRGCLEMMARCDAVIFCDGWHFSKGSKAEKCEAERLGLPCFIPPVALDHLAAWLMSEIE